MKWLRYTYFIIVFVPAFVLSQDNSAPPIYPAPGNTAESQSRENVEAQRDSQTPVFRVNVYARSARAVNYRNRGGSTTLDMKGTELEPQHYRPSQGRWQGWAARDRCRSGPLGSSEYQIRRSVPDLC